MHLTFNVHFATRAWLHVDVLIPANAMQDCWISLQKPGKVVARLYRLLLQFIVENLGHV